MTGLNMNKQFDTDGLTHQKSDTMLNSVRQHNYCTTQSNYIGTYFDY